MATRLILLTLILIVLCYSFAVVNATELTNQLRGGNSHRLLHNHEEQQQHRELQQSMTGKWIVTTPNATILQKRHESCFVMVNRTGVLIGGRGSSKRPNLYNPVRRTWSLGAATPNNIELHHMQCVVISNKVWIVGAWTGSYPKEITTNFTYVYDPVANTWETKPPMPLSRRRGSTAAVVVGNRFIYVAFGNIGGHETANFATSLPWLDMYDTLTGVWTVLPDAKYPRDHTGGALMADGRICVGGGRDGGTVGWPTVAPTECYNITSQTWTVEQNVPSPRAGSSYGTSCDGKLLMAGGELYSLGLVSNSFDVFDGKNWTKYANLNISRHSSGLAVDCVCNAIYIASGSGTAGSAGELLSVETYFPSGVDKKCLA